MKITFNWTFACCFSFFLLFSSHSQAADVFDLGALYFDTVGDEESLPLCCTAVRQDRHGFLWIGTQKGLVRYDGYSFTHFLHSKKNKDSIGGNYILSIWAATDGRIWIGFLAGGISVYDPKTNKFKTYQHDPDDGTSLSHNRVRAIAGDKSGNIWIGTRNGVDYFDVVTEQFKHYSFDEKEPNSVRDNAIHSLLVDYEGNLWIGSSKGLDKFSAKSNKFTHIPDPINTLRTDSGSGVLSLFQSHDGKIWVGNNTAETYWINTKDNSQHVFASELVSKNSSKQVRIKSIAQPTDGEIWLGSFGDGIYVVDVKDGKLLRHIYHDSAIPSSINFNHIGEIWVDGAGLVWVGTWGGGLNLYNPNNAAIKVLRSSPNRPNSLSQPDVSAVLELDDGLIWVGSLGNGINIVDPQIGTVELISADANDINALSNGFINDFVQTADGDVWVGSRKGLQRYNRKTRTFTHFTQEDGLSDNYVRRILSVPSGYLWVATDRGLVRLNLSLNEIEHWITEDETYSAMAVETIFSLAMQQNGDLWIGSSNGLFLLPAKQKKLIHFTYENGSTNSLSHHTITGLLVDSKDTLWIDTPSGLDQLISRKDKVAKFESMSMQVGNFGLSIGSNMLEDDSGRIWTQSSMIDLKALSQLSLGRTDGADFGTFWINAFTKTRQGTLLFGGSNGLLMIKPEKFEEWKYQPSVIISEIKIDGQPQSDIPEELILSSTTKSFSIEFSSSDFSAPRKNRYAYFLDGYDNDWIEVESSHRIIKYTNLDPGNYTLYLRATNRLGEWSTKEFNLQLVQQPKWFQTLWSKFVLVLCLMVIFFGFVKIRLRSLQAQKKVLRKLVKQRTKELELKNIELKSALTNIEEVSLTDQLTKAYNRRFLSKFIDSDLSKLYRNFCDKNNKEYMGEVLGFIVIDIDHFKYINDTFGHSAGDLVLEQFVKILNKTCRESDWIIRWGGEEFLVVARYLKRKEINDLAERIKINVENYLFDIENGETTKCTCSIGTAPFPFIEKNFTALSWEQTLNLADLAMYLVKNNGRNGWVSLSERNISDPQSFYKSAIDNLPNQIEKGVISLQSSFKKITKFKKTMD